MARPGYKSQALLAALVALKVGSAAIELQP
jgi:hypothetical protein